MITIDRLEKNRFKVTVESNTTTTHIVTVSPEDYQQLTGGDFTHEELLRESFRFLLEREPNTSILRKFDLMVIQRYFSDYQQEIQSRLRST
ncbi:MAG: hypothetical protein PVH60_04595 [Anaerolineales bacterium]|jgi:hypothetical protein